MTNSDTKTAWVCKAAWPYVAPFALFIILLALGQHLPGGVRAGYPVRVVAVAACLIGCSRGAVSFRLARPAASALLGVAVFLVWIAPDLIWPGYRSHWLFNNALVGCVGDVLDHQAIGDRLFLFFRAVGAVIVVPIIEELFWRAWLMRYLVSRNFESVALGTFTAPSFWITAVLFASEHGPHWDVGLLAGVAYNWWMVRTRSLGDCIVAHAVTNAVLAAYVVFAGKWEYWL